MDERDREIMRLTVKEGVTEGMVPVWDKLNDHETAIALNQQELKQSMVGQIKQGERIGMLETTTSMLRGKIQRILWILGGIGTAAWAAWQFIFS